MNKLHPSEIALLKDIASTKSSWVHAAKDGIENPNDAIWLEDKGAWQTLSSCLDSKEKLDAFATVVSELMSGLLHSVLVGFDGGTALAEQTTLTICDDDGYEFKRLLHEYWPAYSEEASTSTPDTNA